MNDRQKENGALFGGLVLMCVGTLFLLDRFNVIAFGHVVRYFWPLWIIGLGVWRMLNADVWRGLWLVIVGMWMQISTIHLFGLRFSKSWPLLLIGVGVYVILKALFKPENVHGA